MKAWGVAYSDRIIMIQLERRPVNISIIQIYAPTADKAKEDIDNFYEQLREILRSVKTHKINMIVGDFNAKVGRKITEGVTGGYGLGSRDRKTASPILQKRSCHKKYLL